MSFVRFHSDVFQVFLESLSKNFQSAGDSIVFQMSKDFSIQAMKTIGQQLGVGVEMNPTDITAMFSKRMKESGWGAFKPIKLDLEKYLIEVELHESPYLELMKNEKTIMNYFYRGVLCGYFEYLTRRPLRIRQDETINEEGSLIFHICE